MLPPDTLKKIFIPIIMGMVLLAIPLLRDLHLESAMLAGTVGCFWAGIQASNASQHQDVLSSLHILGSLYLAAVPLFLYSLLSGCLTMDGAGFWLLIPMPSVFFGTAVGRLTRELKLSYPKIFSIVILCAVAIGMWVTEFFTLPQVYFFNHVWGVWPGPIYDEAVQLSGSLFYFRWLTFLWIILLWIIPEWSKNIQTKSITVLALISLMFSYLNLDEMHIISPRQSIQQQLGGTHTTDHFEIYFDEDYFSKEEIGYWAARHEFHLMQIENALVLEYPPEEKIESYLYASAWQKKEITGAKFTSYVPIWLEQDQLHIAKQQLGDVLKHELVHVVSKQFGNRLFSGSYSFGLIEGLAEAIANDASARSTLHQIVAAEKPWPGAERMEKVFSLQGFYGSAGAISYTTTGSFVKYLLTAHPVDNLKAAYASGQIADEYPGYMEDLINEWHQVLEKTPVDSTDQQVSEFIFARRSLFQKTCPRAVNEEWRLWDRYQQAMAEEYTVAAWQQLDALFALNPQNALVKEAWGRAQLLMGNPEVVAKAITSKDSLLSLQAMRADALFLSQGYVEADSLLQVYAPQIEASTARNLKYTLDLREDSLQWSFHLQRRYEELLPDSAGFRQLNLPNKMLSMNQALSRERDGELIFYAEDLHQEGVHSDWFDMYEALIDRLVFLEEYELADSWIEKVNSLQLRLRYQERLNQQREWLHFMQKKYK